MKTENEKVLPKTLPGTVHEQFVRCGKPNCRCANGEFHGPYFYRFARIAGKLKKSYLKPSEVEETRRACLARQEERKREAEQTKEFWRAFRAMREDLRAIGRRYGF